MSLQDDLCPVTQLEKGHTIALVQGYASAEKAEREEPVIGQTASHQMCQQGYRDPWKGLHQCWKHRTYIDRC